VSAAAAEKGNASVGASVPLLVAAAAPSPALGTEAEDIPDVDMDEFLAQAGEEEHAELTELVDVLNRQKAAMLEAAKALRQKAGAMQSKSQRQLSPDSAEKAFQAAHKMAGQLVQDAANAAPAGPAAPAAATDATSEAASRG
jgi:hypothetical protein